MSSEHETVILDDAVAAAQIVALAEEQGWTLVDESTRGHSVMATRVWTTADGTEVAYAEDHTADVRLVETSGPDRARIARLVRDRFTCHDSSSSLDAFDNADPQRMIRDLGRLAVARPKAADPRWIEAWRNALAHEHKSVRRTAIRTLYGCTWPEMIAIIRDKAETEPDAALRGHARTLLATLTEQAPDG